jgi:hypothetical protein
MSQEIGEEFVRSEYHLSTTVIELGIVTFNERDLYYAIKFLFTDVCEYVSKQVYEEKKVAPNLIELQSLLLEAMNRFLTSPKRLPNEVLSNIDTIYYEALKVVSPEVLQRDTHCEFDVVLPSEEIVEEEKNIAVAAAVFYFSKYKTFLLMLKEMYHNPKYKQHRVSMCFDNDLRELTELLSLQFIPKDLVSLALNKKTCDSFISEVLPKQAGYIELLDYPKQDISIADHLVKNLLVEIGNTINTIRLNQETVLGKVTKRLPFTPINTQLQLLPELEQVWSFMSAFNKVQ